MHLRQREQVAHAVALGAQVAEVVGPGLRRQRGAGSRPSAASGPAKGVDLDDILF